MINQIEDQLEQFVPSEMWQHSYYQWLLDFIDKPDNTKIFFWIQGEHLEVSYNVPQNVQGKIQIQIKKVSLLFQIQITLLINRGWYKYVLDPGLLLYQEEI